ncbi:unnamed protein product [Prorocentrum cordatum]|uniref:GATOR2 complex protein MIO zinc-ribbon like domain-containing protein n=1 Tax=Prorocentrum cordatum TaxID=2364126 RepID=A0ABN9WUB3_9DINO|nr:unnamed protein product [Polarella glacialis]
MRWRAQPPGGPGGPGRAEDSAGEGRAVASPARVARDTGGGSLASDALAAAWQWVRLADAPAPGDAEGAEGGPLGGARPRAWQGLCAALGAADGGEAVAVAQLAGGPRAYASPGRLRALRQLGFAEAEAGAPPDAMPSQDDAARRVLRAVLWLQLDKAAADCSELAEPGCGTPARDLAVALQAASGFLAEGRLPDSLDDDVPRRRSVSDRSEGSVHPREAPAHLLEARQPPQHSFRAALLRLTEHERWQELPAAASLRLAVRLLCAAISAPEEPAAEAFEDTVRRLLAEPAAPPHRVRGGARAWRPSVAFRCAVALRFLPRAALGHALQQLAAECFAGGLLDGLCFLGLGGSGDGQAWSLSSIEDIMGSHEAPLPAPPPPFPAGLAASVPDLPFGREGVGEEAGDPGAALVGAYVRHTGDVQSAAVLFCHAAHLSRPPRLARFLVQYASLLSRWRLHQLRDLHDLLAARLPPDAELGGRGSAALCGRCGAVLAQWPARGGEPDAVERALGRRCPNASCARPAPACAVCLQPLFAPAPRAEGPDLASKPSVRLTVDSWVVWCQTCHHGGHLAHLERWFETHTECPVAGCDCRCSLD